MKVTVKISGQIVEYPTEHPPQAGDVITIDDKTYSVTHRNFITPTEIQIYVVPEPF